MVMFLAPHVSILSDIHITAGVLHVVFIPQIKMFRDMQELRNKQYLNMPDLELVPFEGHLKNERETGSNFVNVANEKLPDFFHLPVNAKHAMHTARASL